MLKETPAGEAPAPEEAAAPGGVPEEPMYSGPVGRTVLNNIIPSMASCFLMMVYNLADSVFIGQTHNDLMVAAVSLAAPVFLFFGSAGTLFGVGGASVISRALGAGDRKRAHNASSFCTWTSIAVGIIGMVLVWALMDPILHILGASDDTLEYTRSYLSIVTASGVFALVVNCYANVIRAEGKPKIAMAGSLIGNLLNLILDPIMILALGWEIKGAAIATVIGNIAGGLFYIVYIMGGKFTLSAKLRDFKAGDSICRDVLAVGVPAALTGITMSISQILANSLITAYGDMALAGYAIAGKLRMCLALIGNGVGQGVQPLLAYHFGAKDREKYRKTLNFSLIFALILFTVLTSLCYIFTKPLVNIFLTDSSALTYGVEFTRIIFCSIWSVGVYTVYMAVLQAMGKGTASLIAALSKQIITYIPALYILRAVFGLYGLVWAQPVAEFVSLAVTMALAVRASRKFTAAPQL